MVRTADDFASGSKVTLVNVALQVLLLHCYTCVGAHKSSAVSPPSPSGASPAGSGESSQWMSGRRPSRAANASCGMAEFDACMRQLSSITESDELALAASKHELDMLCSKWKMGHRCMDEHMSRCSDKLKQYLYNDVVQGTRQVMNELCSPGRMQNDYLRLAPCFKSLFVEGGKCSQKYKSMIQWSKASADMTEGSNVEEGLRRTCCTFNEYVHCYYAHMPELCGEEGRDFFRTYTEKMSGPLIHEHCASYTYDSTCNDQAAAAGHPLTARRLWTWDHVTLAAASLVATYVQAAAATPP